MEIRIPKNFHHAGDLSARFASKDPRLPSFADQNVDINLRDCEFVWPSAVLWCAVYALLARARGSKCRLVVPDNKGVCVYLKSLGLFATLQEASVEVDDRDIRSKRAAEQRHILPLTRFHQEDEVEDLANEALEALSRTGLGSSNLYPIVTEVFAELAQNAVQHAESPIDAMGFIQFYKFDYGDRFVCAVADGGIGIRRSLERNPALKGKVLYDWDAIELALQERVSGTGSKTRGIGLYGIAEDMRKADRQLIIHSGSGMKQLMETKASRTTLFPGTLVYASIPA